MTVRILKMYVCMQCNAMQRNAVLCYAMLCYAMIRYVMLCYTCNYLFNCDKMALRFAVEKTRKQARHPKMTAKSRDSSHA